MPFNLHHRLEGILSRLFFGGRRTKGSAYLTYVLGSVFLMLFLFYFLLNTVGYDWTGGIYVPGTGYRLDFLTGGLEDRIPFVPQMVVFYVYLFYPMAVVTMLYFAFVEYRRGYSLGWSLVAVNAIALAIYLVFPVSTYWWREQLLASGTSGDFWTAQVFSIFASDTSFNCFPSLHAAVSTICFYSWYRYYKAKPGWPTRSAAVLAFFVAAGVILSTLFIKQHYVADEVSGTLVAWLVGRLVFNRLGLHAPTIVTTLAA